MATTVADVRYRWYMGPEARLLLLITACLLAFGLATVYSASAIYAQSKGISSTFFFVRQLAGIAVGIVVLAVFAKVDAELWGKYAWPIMLLTIFLLLLIILPFTEGIAPRMRGSRRFLIGSSLQPSELGKIAVIVWTSTSRPKMKKRGLSPDTNATLGPIQTSKTPGTWLADTDVNLVLG